MCGRFTVVTDSRTLWERFELMGDPMPWDSQYNIAPGQKSPVIIDVGHRELHLLRWGLIPHWAKDAKIGYKMTNARLESASEKPSFRQAFRHRRCLVIADGFYEWKTDPETKEKQAYYIQHKTKAPMAFAGLWEQWRSPEGEDIPTFSILTTEANESIAPVHHRMPVILHRDRENEYIDHRLTDPMEVRRLLEGHSESALDFYPVSSYVNKAANSGPQCIEPLLDK